MIDMDIQIYKLYFENILINKLVRALITSLGLYLDTLVGKFHCPTIHLIRILPSKFKYAPHVSNILSPYAFNIN